MPLYQLLCITPHYSEFKIIKELVRQSSLHIMNAGGVVRNINSWGTYTLPQRMRRTAKHSEKIGDYWTLHFDTSPRTVRTLNNFLRQEPRVLRWTVLKLGEKIEDVATEGQKIIQEKTKDSQITFLS